MKNWLLGMALASSLSAFAQGTVCNADGTVTFQYKNENAHKVAVDVQFAGRHDMKQNPETKLWTVTLGPAAPDMYPYHFIVDGVDVMDPECKQYFPNEGFKNSLLEIPDQKGALAHDILPVKHGNVEYIHYYSKSLGGVNNAVVYTPYGYETSNKSYPVFYVISGTTDTEDVFFKVGRVNFILDNLIAKGKAKEMIIVMPYGNPGKLREQRQKDIKSVTDGFDIFGNDFNNDLMPYIEKHYRTINDADHRAIAGFSRGGNQALMNGLLHLDKFSYLCSYSSFTSMDLPKVYDNAKETNKKIHLFWMGIGKDDFLYGTSRDYMEFLDKKGIKTIKEFTEGKFGHTWMNCKYFLSRTLPLLFNPKASAKAMKKCAPAPKATGKEVPFTPSVMAKLFQKPVVSPEFTKDNIIFRFKAPDATNVYLNSYADNTSEVPVSIMMKKDAEGIWSVSLPKYFDRKLYYFVVNGDGNKTEGMKVVDPNNMYYLQEGDKAFSVVKPNEMSSTFDKYAKLVYDFNQNKVTFVPVEGGDWNVDGASKSYSLDDKEAGKAYFLFLASASPYLK